MTTPTPRERDIASTYAETGEIAALYAQMFADFREELLKAVRGAASRRGGARR